MLSDFQNSWEKSGPTFASTTSCLFKESLPKSNTQNLSNVPMCVQNFIKIGSVVSEKLALQKRIGEPGRAGSPRFFRWFMLVWTHKDDIRWNGKYIFYYIRKKRVCSHITVTLPESWPGPAHQDAFVALVSQKLLNRFWWNFAHTWVHYLIFLY